MVGRLTVPLKLSGGALSHLRAAVHGGEVDLPSYNLWFVVGACCPFFAHSIMMGKDIVPRASREAVAGRVSHVQFTGHGREVAQPHISWHNSQHASSGGAILIVYYLAPYQQQPVLYRKIFDSLPSLTLTIPMLGDQ